MCSSLHLSHRYESATTVSSAPAYNTRTLHLSHRYESATTVSSAPTSLFLIYSLIKQSVFFAKKKRRGYEAPSQTHESINASAASIFSSCLLRNSISSFLSSISFAVITLSAIPFTNLLS